MTKATESASRRTTSTNVGTSRTIFPIPGLHYTLWVQLGTVDGDAWTLRTPNDEPCAVDPFAYSTLYNEAPPSFDRTLFFTNVGCNAFSINYLS
jgi:hypothetical protein